MNKTFHLKYLKYKNKYLNLKKQMGGEEVKELNCLFEKTDNKYVKHFDSIITKNIVEDKLFIIINQDDIKIIGSGGYGKIILINTGTIEIPDYYVVKLMYGKENCHNTKQEYNNINVIFNAFEIFKRLNLSEHELNRLIKFINPLKAYGYYLCNIKFNNEDTIYNCCLITSYSKGYDITTKIIPNLEPDFKYIDELKQNYTNILVMPFIAEQPDRTYISIDTRISNEPISANNPVRYGILNVKHLNKLIGNEEYISDYGKIMGIIQGIILWSAKMNTEDLEILLGPTDTSYVYNLVDYGMLKTVSSVVDKIIAKEINGNNINNLVVDIASLGSPFFAKQSFPVSESGNLLTDFLTYFKITGKLINGDSIPNEVYDLINEKLKEEI